jgi:HlyD family type I secretion membrane fusion protein
MTVFRKLMTAVQENPRMRALIETIRGNAAIIRGQNAASTAVAAIRGNPAVIKAAATVAAHAATVRNHPWTQAAATKLTDLASRVWAGMRSIFAGSDAAERMLGAPVTQGPPLRVPAIIGLSTGIAFLVGFILLGSLASMEGAAIASGTIQVEGNRKAVQHLEGGIVAELPVYEGAIVKAGERLVRLDDTMARASVDQMLGQLRAAVAQEARLVAERDDRAEITIPAELAALGNDPSVAEMLAAQQSIFASRRESILGQTNILRQRDLQAQEQIAGLSAQVKAQERALALVTDEAETVATLVKSGLERKPRLQGLQRQIAEIEGQRAHNLAEIARIRQTISETALRVIDLRTQMLTDAVRLLREEQTRIYDLRERLRAAEDVLARLEIRAPVSGKVVGLKVFTVGGVVQPREPIMEIVPTTSLIVEAQVSPADIDTVRAGLPVRLNFSAFASWIVPTIDGTVTDVSGDRFVDQRTGASHYMARIAVNAQQVAKHNLELRPGMPVEAMIVTGKRTMLQYLLEPVTAILRRSLTEQ